MDAARARPLKGDLRKPPLPSPAEWEAQRLAFGNIVDLWHAENEWRRVAIGSVPHGAAEAQIRDVTNAYGTIRGALVEPDWQGTSATVLVLFEEVDAASKAVAALSTG